ncbi:MAG: transglycosylase domain-containing protein [Terrimicrobiaceae bacterium]|nr:transglycosylase domain-containing protein [Terrimicrobiaceae bacterium]
MIAGFVTFSILRSTYQHRAEEFNLADIERMEAATLVFDRNGELVGKFFLQNRIPVTDDQIAPMMTKAVIAAEDNRFYDHDGVDYWGIVRAALKNYRSGRIKQGASTVTQQLARNSFDMHERTYKRKFIEMFLASRIEKSFSKAEIMTLYLNRVYFGSGLYGIEAAARGYFGVPAKELSVGQCATLASLLKNPNRLSPWNNPDGARVSRDFVLGRMQDMGFISSDEAKAEREALLITSRRMNPTKISYAVDYVRQQAIAALGYDRAMNGGFKIYSTLDLRMQRSAEAAIRAQLNEIERRPGYDHETYAQFVEKFRPFDDVLRTGGFPSSAPPTPHYVQGAAIAYDNRTGGILALVGGREFKHSEYNRATQSKRPAGTAFTPLVLAAACEKGIFPGELVQDSALDNRYVGIGGTTGILGEWGVERAGNEYEGGIPARDAIAKGKNAATVRLGWLAGLDAVQSLARKAGIGSPVRNLSNSFLGASEASLDELTLAFTMIPGGGIRPAKPYVIDRIVDSSGSEIFKQTIGRVPVVADSTAYQVHAALDDALHSGTGAAAVARYGLHSFPAGVKTGTAYNFTDTYAIGYTSAVTCGVWVGFDRPTRIFRGAFGSDLALPIWAQVMNASAQDFRPQAIARPASIIPVSICRTSGLLETARCEREVRDPQTGAMRREKTAYIEFATAKSKPTIPCDVHGTGLRLYAKEQAESEWPRAASAVDLAAIRPIAVGAPALMGLNDVYRSVKPAALRMREDEIPVAKAEAVNQQVAAAALAEGQAAQGVPVAGPVPKGSQEVRKAEAVKPMDVPSDNDAIPLDAPAPIQF